MNDHDYALPNNLEAEKAVLGAAMAKRPAAEYLTDFGRVGLFYRRSHGLLFEALRKLVQSSTPTTLSTIKAALGGDIEEAGGAAYVSTLADGAVGIDLAQHLALLADLEQKRLLMAFARATLAQAATSGDSAADILRDADARLLGLHKGQSASGMRSVRETADALLADVEHRIAHRGELTGIGTGYAILDQLTQGWQPGTMNIIAARPSVGKTALAMQFALQAALHARRVAVCSLEMTRLQLEHRLLSQMSGIPLSRLLGGHVAPADCVHVDQVIGVLKTMHLSIDDRVGQTVSDLRASCRRMVADGGLDMLVIDYVQLMPGQIERKSATRTEELADISLRLKVMAGELGIPILLLSQLSRAGDKRQDQRPILSDLRDCGSLEQDADLVLFLHRANHGASGATELIIAKQRNGPIGAVNLSLDRSTVTFRAEDHEQATAKTNPKPTTLYDSQD